MQPPSAPHLPSPAPSPFPGAPPAPDDPARLRAELEAQLLRLSQDLYEMEICAGEVGQGMEEAVPGHLAKINQALINLAALAPQVTDSVPRTVVDHVDRYKNPHQYTKTALSRATGENQYALGRVLGLESFRRQLQDSITEAFPGVPMPPRRHKPDDENGEGAGTHETHDIGQNGQGRDRAGRGEEGAGVGGGVDGGVGVTAGEDIGMAAVANGSVEASGVAAGMSEVKESEGREVLVGDASGGEMGDTARVGDGDVDMVDHVVGDGGDGGDGPVLAAVVSEPPENLLRREARADGGEEEREPDAGGGAVGPDGRHGDRARDGDRVRDGDPGGDAEEGAEGEREPEGEGGRDREPDREPDRAPPAPSESAEAKGPGDKEDDMVEVDVNGHNGKAAP